MSDKILIILPHEGFRDKEYTWLVERLDMANISYVVASSHISPANGRFGTTVKPDTLLNLIHKEDYSGYIFVGEEASSEFIGSGDIMKILEHSVDCSKMVGAIGYATLILARSNMIVGRRVTAPSELQPQIEEAGGYFRGRLVSVDGNLITASGPYGTREFSDAIVEYLTEGVVRSGREYLR